MTPRKPLPADAPKYLTVAEVADMLRTSKMTVYRLIQTRELTAKQFGRAFRIDEAALQAYIDGCDV